MKKVLFFSAWYPHRYDSMSGLFVRKHAEAVSKYVDVCVLFLYADKSVDNFEFKTKKTGAVTEVYVYFPFFDCPVIRKFSKSINYFRAFLKGYKVVVENFGKPTITHANVLTRSGFLSYFLFKTRNIPYVITEHWSRYFSERHSYNGWFRKKITEIVVKNAGCVMPVSSALETAMKNCNLCNENYHVVENVVDDFFFTKEVKKNRPRKRLIHVSCFDDSVKNISGIIRTIERLSKVRTDFELFIIGTGPDYERIVAETKEKQLYGSTVVFLGEQTPMQVATWMKQSDFFVLFSNAENAPVVISESLACGLPVVATSVGAIPQMITPENGVVVPVGNESCLYNAIDWMLDNFQNYDENVIREIAKKYSFDKVGKQMFSIYEQV